MLVSRFKLKLVSLLPNTAVQYGFVECFIYLLFFSSYNSTKNLQGDIDINQPACEVE